MDEKMNWGVENFNRLIIHPSFNETIKEINQLKIKLPYQSISEELDFRSYIYPLNGELLNSLKDIINNIKLNPRNGTELLKNNKISAYDESINKFMGLEGTAYLMSHSLIVHGKDDYFPSNFLTFNFYTRSKSYIDQTKFLKYSEDPERDSKLDYIKDRTDFILNNIPKNSIILIDGPLIGGQVSSYTISLNNELLRKNVIPIFFIKNSNSNLVTDNIVELKQKFNSDMHWAYNTLNAGERTVFFKYVDKYNDQNAKIFCYLKAFNISPQRIEFHINTFEKYENEITELMDLIYYLLLIQGDLKNPQIRSIAIAEKFARETLKLINLNKLIRSYGIMPILNQERFGWT